ncbi:MAG: ceramidase [Candidatus Nanopelagicales bacterium]|jgi:hypothetical protein|nr:ceramidase [Candidatus Nanopelagicales bacterium]
MSSTREAVGVGASAGQIGCSDCERIRDGWLAQPVNALTSLAFVGAAGVVLARTCRPAEGRRGEVAAYSAVLALVGAGSVAFHGPQPPGARVMHDLPIPVLIAMGLGTPLIRSRRGLDPLPGWNPRRGAHLAATAVAAVAAYAGGRTGAPTCDPDSPLQLHGVWHVLCAAGFITVADILYRSGTHE